MLNNKDHEDREKFDITLENAIGLYDAAIKSGKEEKPENYDSMNSDEKYSEIFNILAASASESKNREMINPEQATVEEKEDEGTSTLALIIILAITALFTVICCAFCFYRCNKKKTPQYLHKDNPET